jgi:probable phosphoglycerate mutase
VSEPLRIFLLRHGETAWSLTGRHTGLTDLALTGSGEAQARALAPALAEIAFDGVLTSPRLRARQTCQWAGLGSRAEVDPDLAEWDYGAYEGLRTAEIRAARPGWSVWRDGCPEGEMPEDISARADRVVARLRGRVGAVALFSHGQFGRVLAARWLGLPARDGQGFALAPASVSTLGFEDGDASRPVILLWNAAASALGGIRPSSPVPT